MNSVALVSATAVLKGALDVYRSHEFATSCACLLAAA